MPKLISFKYRQFKKDTILMLVRWYLAYSLSYRDIEELAAERGLQVDHSTVNRWVIYYASKLEESFRKNFKRNVNTSYRMDETYLKIKGRDVYLYRAVDKFGKTIDFKLSEKRDKKSAFLFFQKCITQHELPEKVTMDKSGSNKAAIDLINLQLSLFFILTGIWQLIKVRQIKYLNNLVEQDHQSIKKITKPMMGFKSFQSAEATIAGIELHHMLRKKQHKQSANIAIYELFYRLAG
jgi:putative transposase